MRAVPVKLHYDDNRRVTLERRDYFYAPLPGTPFGLAVAIPHYGTTWIKVEHSLYLCRKLPELQLCMRTHSYTPTVAIVPVVPVATKSFRTLNSFRSETRSAGINT